MATKVVKVTLASGKIVLLREMKISDTENAAAKVSKRADGDALMLQIYIKKVLLQMLIVKYAEDDKATPRELTGNEKADLDTLFSIGDFSDLMKVIGKMSGDSEGNEPTMEFSEG